MKDREKSDFFNKIVSGANFVDPDLARDLYFALIRLIIKELREGGSIELPNFGTFRVHVHKARRSVNVSSGSIINLPPCPTVKFSPTLALKYYFKEKNSNLGTG